MGAERWLRFSSKTDATAARAYLEGRTDIFDDELESNAWLDWTRRGMVLELGFSFGGYNDAVATISSREIARRFPVTRIGADSVGWYADKDWQSTDPRGAPARYGAFTTWAEWIKEYDPVRFSDGFRITIDPDYASEVRALDARICEQFVAMDVAAGRPSPEPFRPRDAP